LIYKNIQKIISIFAPPFQKGISIKFGEGVYLQKSKTKMMVVRFEIKERILKKEDESIICHARNEPLHRIVGNI